MSDHIEDSGADAGLPVAARSRGVAARAGSWLTGALFGQAGERRLKPVAAALMLPLLVLVVGGSIGLKAHLSAAGGPASVPPARADAAMAYDAERGQVVMFGGEGLNGVLDDTWTWDGNGWTQQHPALSPPPRFGAAMAFDASRHVVVMYGGAPYFGPQETWTWDGSTWHHVQTLHSPMGFEAGMAFDPQTHQLVLVTMGGVGLESAGAVVGGGAAGHVASPPGAEYSSPPYPNGIVVPPPGPNVVPPGSPTQVHPSLVPVPLHVAPVPVQGTTQGFVHGPPPVIGNPNHVGIATFTWTGSDWLPAGNSPTAFGGVGPLHPAWDAADHQLLLVTSETPPVQCVATGEVLPPPKVASPPMPAPTVGRGSAGRSGYVPLTQPPDDSCMRIRTQTGIGTCANCVHVREWTWDGMGWRDRGIGSRLLPQPMLANPATDTLFALTASSTLQRHGSSWDSTPNPAGLLHRSGESLAADTGNKVVVLFGGRQMGGSGYGSDTWTWDGHSWTQRGGVAPPAPTPFVMQQGSASGTCTGVAQPTVGVTTNARDGAVGIVTQTCTGRSQTSPLPPGPIGGAPIP